MKRLISKLVTAMTKDAPTPGDASPGDASPGDATPGDATPGDATPGDATPGEDKTGAPVVIGHTFEMESRILGEARRVSVGLPAAYVDGRTYPVVYVLDGPDHFHHTTATAQYLAANGRMPEVIVVAIANTDRARDLTSPTEGEMAETFPTHGGSATFRRYIGTELMPWVAGRYGAASFNILIGHSFGGLFALETLVEAPDMFDATIAISPSLQWNDQALVGQLETALADGRSSGNLYLTVGNEGGALLGGVRKAAAALGESAPVGFRWDYARMSEESHGSVPHRSTYQGFEFVFEGWHLADPIGLYRQGGIELMERHFARLSERLGLERTLTPADVANLAWGLFSVGALEESVAVVSADPSRWPVTGFVLGTIANAVDEKGDSEVAIELWKRALETDPGNLATRGKLEGSGVDVAGLLPKVEIPETRLRTYAGTYELGALPITIRFEDGQLISRAEGFPPGTMQPMSESRFYFDGAPYQMEFIEEDGVVTGLRNEMDVFAPRRQ